ncbi:MAG: substrate-binding domain-containing protein [Candidatus Methanomethylicaceae archaeon]
MLCVTMIIAGGNPKGIKGIEDLRRRDIKIVNRNPGSHTRSLLKRLLSANINARGKRIQL